MNRPSIVMLTWCTVAAAVLSACLLAGGEAGLPDSVAFAMPERAAPLQLPTAPTGAGPARAERSQSSSTPATRH